MGRYTTKVTPSLRQLLLRSIGPVDSRRLAVGVRPQPVKIATVTRTQVIATIVNWSLCLLLMFLLLSQSLTIILNSSKSAISLSYGRDQSLGTYALSGFNDEPYSDRVLVCRRRGRRFEVISANEALSDVSTVVEDNTTTNVNGYRIVNRKSAAVSINTRLLYENTCARLNATIEKVLSACSALGYLNTTHDSLRIVNGVYSSTLYRIPNTLPILIMPYWDNAPSARYAIPEWDGHTCLFRLGGKYEVATAKDAYLYGINRTVREAKTVEFLNRPGGKWSNGWYEDSEGIRWYSDVLSTNLLNADGLASRRFDLSGTIQELDCVKDKSKCLSSVVSSSWGNLVVASHSNSYDSITISNGDRYGIFQYKSVGYVVVTCVYNTTIFTADLSFAWLLVQWLLSMIAVQRGFFKNVSAWHNTNIGCLANSNSFAVLIFTSLPRAKMIIAAFLTIGCTFEGDQLALSDAWFVMYPAIVNMVLLHTSVLNVVAKIFRRRMASWHIPGTIVLLSLLHWLREQIASSDWFGFDGRLSTLVTPEEFEAMSLFQLLTPTTSLRLNGNIRSLYLIKLLALFLNTLPLVFSRDMSLRSKQSQAHISCKSEMTLNIRACNVGGLGFS